MTDITVISQAQASIILATPQTITLLEQGSSPTLLQVGAGVQGPPGSTGPAGSSAVITTAATALGGQRAVVQDAAGAAWYADNTDATHMGRFAGITQGAADAGAPVTLITTGTLTEPSWAWTPEAAVYLGSNGLLTQNPPSSGFLQIIGMALAATVLFISPREPLVIL